MNHIKISAIVCAAGLSSRMAPKNKLLLPFGRLTILEHTLDQLIQSQVNEVIVVLGHDYAGTSGALQEVKNLLKIIYNENYRSGQTSTIRKGLNLMNPDHQAFMICLADMPLLTTIHYDLLIDHYKKALANDSKAISRPLNNGDPGHPVIMSGDHRLAVDRCKDREGCRTVIQDQKLHFYPYVSSDESYYLDADTEGAYKLLLKKSHIDISELQ